MGINNLLVTRFPNGVNNQAQDSIFGGQLPFPINLNQRVFDEDFYTYTAAQWTVTETQAGATQAIANPGNGGLLTLVNSAANSDLNAIQRVASGISGESWTLDPAKRFWARFQIACNEDTEVAWIAGLQITDVTPLAVSDGIYFRKAAAATAIAAVAAKDGTEITGAVGTALGTGAVAATGLLTGLMTLDMFYDGQGATDGRLYFAYQGAVAGYIVPAGSFPNDEALTLSFAVSNGEAAAKTLWLDRALVIQEI
jgi:hypothetical protein